MRPGGPVVVAERSSETGPSGISMQGVSMRLFHAAAPWVLAAMLGFAAMAQPQAGVATLHVLMDKALILKYPASTETIVVGNPVIADVTMVRNSGIVILTGKSFGETNLVFLDREGTLLSESNVRVESPAAIMTVQRGLDRETYSCHPRCEPMISVGDTTNFLSNLAGDIKTRNGAAVPTTAASAPSGGMGSH